MSDLVKRLRMTLPAWQQGQLDLLLGRLSDWRNADQEDAVVIGRSDIIAILDAVKDFTDRIEALEAALREAQGSITAIAAECHRAKWEFDMNDEEPPKAAAVRVLVDKAFYTLHRIGDLAIKAKDATLTPEPEK